MRAAAGLRSCARALRSRPASRAPTLPGLSLWQVAAVAGRSVLNDEEVSAPLQRLPTR